jgi:hypothetical protein
VQALALRARAWLTPACTSNAAGADIFVSSQHKAALLDSSWFADAFAQAVTRIGHTLLVLQPWDAPLPLKRSWCLWELLSTVDGGAQLEVVLSPAQSAAFQDALVRALVDRGGFLVGGDAARINACAHVVVHR